MTRKISLLILPLALASLALPCTTSQSAQTNAASAPQASTASTNEIVAKGKGMAIRRGELDLEVTHALAEKAANGRRVEAYQMPSVEQQVLGQLIDIRLLLARATEAEKAVSKESAEKRYAVAKTKLGSEAAFNLQLKFLATTREELTAKWAQALTAQAVLKRELKINITDQQASKFFEENPAQFDVPETVRASHILIATRDPHTRAELSADQQATKRKRAEAVLKRARAGEDFAILAMAFSNDMASRANGGEFTFMLGQMPTNIEVATLSLKTNQISDLVTSPDGYHIIKLREKIPAHKITYAGAAADIKNDLALQAIEQQSPDYVAKLRKEAGVEILDEKLKPEAEGPPPVVAPDAPTKRPG